MLLIDVVNKSQPSQPRSRTSSPNSKFNMTTCVSVITYYTVSEKTAPRYIYK